MWISLYYLCCFQLKVNQFYRKYRLNQVFTKAHRHLSSFGGKRGKRKNLIGKQIFQHNWFILTYIPSYKHHSYIQKLIHSYIHAFILRYFNKSFKYQPSHKVQYWESTLNWPPPRAPSGIAHFKFDIFNADCSMEGIWQGKLGWGVTSESPPHVKESPPHDQDGQ